MARRSLLALLLTVLFPLSVFADFDVKVDLENVSGEKKANWPVVLAVYQVFGRDLPRGCLNPKGYHVYAPDGQEVECAIEEIPPDDVESNNELSFIVPAMEPGQKLTYRIANTDKASDKQRKPDLVGNANNLLANPGFELGGPDKPEGYSGLAVLDKEVKRSGAGSLRLAGAGTRKATYTATIKLHQDSPYYFGVWCKTDNVARHGVHAALGAHFVTTGFPEGIMIMPQCYTRDWNKSRFFARYGIGFTDWGNDLGCVPASGSEFTMNLVLDQQRQYALEKPDGKWWLDDATFFEQPKVTVRFDLALQPAMKDGCFLFTRPVSSVLGKAIKVYKQWYSRPYAHEAFTQLDESAVKGQRALFFFGLYHTQPLSKVRVEVDGSAVKTADGASISIESLEYSRGYSDEKEHPGLFELKDPVDFPGPDGVRYFLVTVRVPRDAKPGKYQGRIKLFLDQDKLYRDIPITLRVQDLEQPVLRDVYIGSIIMNPGFGEETLKMYGRSGFSSIAIFGGFFKYTKDATKDMVDLDDLAAKMKLLMDNGVTAGVNPFSEFDLGPLWGGGKLYKKCDGNKERFQHEVKRIDDFVNKHPEWPRMIYMTWDEPNPGETWVKGKHGGVDERMGWVNEVCPKALTKADVMFPLLPQVFKYYTMPCFDDPCDYAGPELYEYFRKNNKLFGMASNAWGGERCRYNYGMLMATSGASYMHSYHLGYAMLMQDEATKKPYRTLSLVAAGQGMDDYKAFRLLADSIHWRAAADADQTPAGLAAEKYLEGVFKVWNGDHGHASGPAPYLGRAYHWGYERFYDDWQEQMLKHACAVKGVKWIE